MVSYITSPLQVLASLVLQTKSHNIPYFVNLRIDNVSMLLHWSVLCYFSKYLK